MQDPRNLTCWQKADKLEDKLFAATQNFPRGERNRLTDQILRAADSVASNILEGKGRLSDREFARFLKIANGSAMELRNHIAKAIRRGYLKDDTLYRDADEVQRMVYSLLCRVIDDLRCRGELD